MRQIDGEGEFSKVLLPECRRKIAAMAGGMSCVFR